MWRLDCFPIIPFAKGVNFFLSFFVSYGKKLTSSENCFSFQNISYCIYWYKYNEVESTMLGKHATQIIEILFCHFDVPCQFLILQYMRFLVFGWILMYHIILGHCWGNLFVFHMTIWLHQFCTDVSFRFTICTSFP